MDELPQCLLDSSIGQPPIAPSEYCYWSTFCQIFHATGPLQWIVFRRASTSDKFQMNFSSNRTPTGFLQQKVFVRASTADDFRLQHQCPRHPTTVDSSATSKTSELLLDCRDREPFCSIRRPSRASAVRPELSGKSRQWPLPYSTLCNRFHVAPPLSGKSRQRTPLHSPQ